MSLGSAHCPGSGSGGETGELVLVFWLWLRHSGLSLSHCAPCLRPLCLTSLLSLTTASVSCLRCCKMAAPGSPGPALPPSPRLGPLWLRLRQWPPPAHPGCLRHTTYTTILAFGNMHFLGDLVNTDIQKKSMNLRNIDCDWVIKPSLLSASPVASFNGPWLSSMLRGAGRERRLNVTHVNIDNCRIPSTCPSQACHVYSLTN